MRAAELGVSLVPTYGMTETCSQIATAIPGTTQESAGVIGPLLDGFSVSIRRSSGDAVTDEVGVIEVEGLAVFGGYTDEPFRSGPFTTSDLGFMSKDGQLSVVGRIDDVVVTGGENVSLSGVSSVIEEVVGVLDVAVVGIPDEEWGTAVCAIVGIGIDASEGDVTDAISAGLPPRAVPKRIEFGSVPLLRNGKHDMDAVQRFFDAE
jgi:O-succinylbenzoic acid--CoA ligase